MLVNATFVPDTALLVPGAAGAAEVLADVRSAAVAAVGGLLDDAPARVVVVAPGPADRTRTGPFAPSLAAAGIDDAVLGWTPPPSPDATGAPVTSPGAAAALLLLAHAGWTGPVTLAEVPPPSATAPDRPDRRPGADGRPGDPAAPGRDLTALGRDLTAGPDRVGLLVAGSLSARRGPGAPLAEDGRAPAVDEAFLADLRDAGPPARDRLAAVDPGVAADLAVTAWAPWQVALGAVPPGATVRSAVHHVAAPFGVTYVVASWRPS